MAGALSNNDEWKFVYTEKFLIKSKWASKKQPNELRVLLERLDTYMRAINICNEPQQVIYGWLHPEPHGVKAIIEKGKGGSLKAMRLYFFPNKNEKTVLLLTIGDKNTQSEDIKFCNEQIEQLNKNK